MYLRRQSVVAVAAEPHYWIDFHSRVLQCLQLRHWRCRWVVVAGIVAAADIDTAAVAAVVGDTGTAAVAAAAVNSHHRTSCD